MARMTYAQLAAENAALRHNYDILETRMSRLQSQLEHSENQLRRARDSMVMQLILADTRPQPIQTSPL